MILHHVIVRPIVAYIHLLNGIGVYLAALVFYYAWNKAIVGALLLISKRAIIALTESLSGVVFIVKSIFTNEMSKDIIRYMIDHLYELLTFLFDLVRPSGVISYDRSGIITEDPSPEGPSNRYWELDLTVEGNRSAIGAQLKRVFYTITELIRLGIKPKLPAKLEEVRMDIWLKSDFDHTTTPPTPPTPTYTASLSPDSISTTLNNDEKWIFVNGIGNERIWFESACRKLREAFSREILGVYNRSDGILWDMIQCFGDDSLVDKDNTLLQRTKSSMEAQASLKKQLEKALWPQDGSLPPRKVVLLCHSQGCLLTRLALQQLVQENREGSLRRHEMREKLRIFTFANPSMDWKVVDTDLTPTFLSNFAHTTEHFAHKVDFVAMLGVVRHMTDIKSGFENENSMVFLSRRGVGHLFGAHYALDPSAYVDGEMSRLFAAIGGEPIA